MFKVFGGSKKAKSVATTTNNGYAPQPPSAPPTAAQAAASKQRDDTAMLAAAASSSSSAFAAAASQRKSNVFSAPGPVPPVAGGSKSFGKSSGGLLTTPGLKSVPPGERPAMFVHHLVLAQQVFNFNDPTIDMEEKEAKRVLLLGLVEHINSAKDVFSESVFPEVMSMLGANLFRDLPHNESETGNADEEEPMLEQSWPHLQIVYEFLLRFVVSPDVDAKVAKKYISQPFISQLLELFNSEDPREREYLKTILHRVYGKYMGLRAFIRRAINYVFFRIMYESESHNGIGELLEILGSIINGFALPLKAEHKRFLVRALIPLHKVRGVGMFHNQLSYCVNQFVEKDPKMIEPILLGILRFWPHSSSPKQIFFLNEVEDLLELTQPSEFQKICVPLFQTINLCINSPHFQVSERALFLWNNEYVVSLVNQNRHQILPLVISNLNRNSTEHWNQTVMALTGNVVKLFQEMDKNFYRECQNSTSQQEKTQLEGKLARIKQWDLLEKEALALDVI
ncbi:hypothetical protein BASA81_001261 [Batrachochytrium salamandrivorans]|nr:hypothetical protein BASA81_001261 [Batrachochytrium salamandrivorans]